MPHIAVIIPFYQRERGLLRRAVNSILSQIDKDARVIIVDDGSPVSAQDDLRELAGNSQLILLKQANAGVAAARNTALDHVPGSTDIVAFLDSDDWWMRSHLEKIVFAYNAGADFYFCNYRRGTQKDTIFDITIPDLFHLPRLCESIAWLDRSLLDVVITKSPLAPSTCAYRFGTAKNVRFDNRFRRACEDRRFFAELSKSTKKVAFSSECDVGYGEGVNIFGSSVWGTVAGAQRVLDTLRFHLDLQQFDLTETQRRNNASVLPNLDAEFAENVLVASFHDRRIPTELVRQYSKLRPGIMTSIFATSIRLAIRKLNFSRPGRRKSAAT